jgi:hypothetical protein
MNNDKKIQTDTAYTPSAIMLHSTFNKHTPFEIRMTFDGQNSYLWFGMGGVCCGTLSGNKLRNLLKKLNKEMGGK